MSEDHGVTDYGFVNRLQINSMENLPDFSDLNLKSFEGVFAPANMQRFAGTRGYGSTVDPYAPNHSDSPSLLVNYLKLSDPVAMTDSLPVFISPMVTEEDVIVMDAIPGPKFSKGGGQRKSRLSLTSSHPLVEIGGRSNPAVTPVVGGGGGLAENRKSDRNKLCRNWETSGNCKFGSTCQFAHGKEQLRPPRLSGKTKVEILKSISIIEGSSSSAHGEKSTPTIQVKPSVAEEGEEEKGFPLLSRPPGELKQISQESISSSTIPETAMPRSNWSPLDDGIEVSLPSGSAELKSPSREEVDAYIDEVLYGTGKRSASLFF